MKRLIENKGLWKKLLISICIVSTLTCSVPVYSQAGVGGILEDALTQFFAMLFDTVVSGLQMFLVDGQFDSTDGFGFMAKSEEFRIGNSLPENLKEFAPNYTEGNSKVVIEKKDLEKADFKIPVIKYTPDKIFSCMIPALDVNFINPKDWNNANMNDNSIAIKLHSTIANWYVSLRNLTLVALMIILLYIGIRIVISSTASDKAKYKKMIGDWLIALCLLVSMHYIMSFINMFIDEISAKLLSNGNEYGNNIYVEVQNAGTIEYAFNTDLMGLVRFKTQIPGQRFLCLIFYMALVFYSCYFTFKYLKRVIDIAFLTMFAPVMVLTYPIDKMKDGKAQAYDSWFKEYVFLSLIQPFHLIIYSVFIGSAIDLATSNWLYAIVVMASLGPAEKLLRKFFGFDKSSMGSAIGGFAGGATAMALAQQAFSGGKNKGKTGSKNTDNIRQKSGNFEKEKAPGLDDFADELGVEENTQPRFMENPEDESNMDFTKRNNSELTNEDNNQIIPGFFESNKVTPEGKKILLPDSIKDDAIDNYNKEKEKKEDEKHNLSGQNPQRENDTEKPININNANTNKRNIKKSAGVARVAKKFTGRALKKVGRGAIRTAGTLAGATFGLAAGITSGNFSDIAKFASAGAALGYGAAGKGMQSVQNLASGTRNLGREIADTYMAGAGISTKEARYERQKRDFIKENGKELEDKYKKDNPSLSDEEVKDKVNYTAQLNNYKFDESTIEKTMKLRDKYITNGMDKSQAEKRAAAVAKERKKYDDKDMSSRETISDIRENLRNRGLSKDMTEKIIKDMINF